MEVISSFWSQWTDGVLLFIPRFLSEWQHCLFKRSDWGHFSLMHPSCPSCNGFSGCNNIDFICVNFTAICSCCTFVSSMTLVSHSETAFQAEFPQVSQVQFASFFPLLLRCKCLSLECGIECECLFKAPTTLITNHSSTSVFPELYLNWKTALLGKSPGIAMMRTSLLAY